MRRLFALVILVGCLGQDAVAANDSCNPDFGDKALDWVGNHARRQSRDLTKADYDGRAFNFRLVGFERLHDKLRKINEELDGVSAAIDELDRSARPEVALAVQREIASRRYLTRLYTTIASIEETEEQLRRLTAPLSLAAFLGEGYRAVGRETLVASIREVGAAAEATLNGRYGFYIEVTFNENGAPEGGSAKPSTPGGNFTGVGISLLATGEPYAMIGGAILVIIGGVIDSDCAQNWRTQEQRLREASETLPKELITDDEQWSMFQSAEQGAAKRFGAHGDAVKILVSDVRKRWAALFAANAARAAASASVLTAARIANIELDMRNGLDPAAISEQVALTNVASDVGRVNAAVARGRVDVLQACRNVAGLANEEDQGDALAFARAQFMALRRQAAFVPLYDLLDRSLTNLSLADQELRSQGPTPSNRPCNANNETAFYGLHHLSETLMPMPAIAVGAGVSNIKSASRSRRTFRVRTLAARAASAGGWQRLCSMVSRGAVYSCGRGGPTYGGQFGSGSGDAGRDIHQGAQDGGFAQDSRRLSGNVDAARANIDARIADVRKRVQDVETALPEWIQTNGNAAEEAAVEVRSDTAREVESSQQFEQAQAPLLERVRGELDRFVTSPSDVDSIRELVGASGAEDMRLPALHADVLVATGPEIAGIEARQSKFGAGLNGESMAVMREKIKVRRDLGSHSTQLALAETFTDYAQRAAAEGGIAAQTLTRQLLLDSTVQRLSVTGRIPHPEVSVVEKDGTITRRSMASVDELPPNALINVVQRYYRDDAYYRMSAAKLHAELNSGAPFAGRRMDIANTAASLAVLARAEMRAGDVLAAQQLMGMAIGVLDVATRFLPGVSWGRDVYEAVTGRDLFTGEELSTFDRVTATIGAITGGLGDDGLKIFRVLQRIDGVPAKHVDEIYEFARTADGATLVELQYADHARERLAERFIDEADLRNVLDNHLPYFHNESLTYQAIGKSQGRDLVVGINVEKKQVTTAFWPDNLESLLSDRIKEGRNAGKIRYQPLDLND